VDEETRRRGEEEQKVEEEQKEGATQSKPHASCVPNPVNGSISAPLTPLLAPALASGVFD